MAIPVKEVAKLFEVVGRLPKERVSQVLDFARFVLWQETGQEDEATDFERWAEGLAQARGFAHLAEDEVAYIVQRSRETGT